MLVIGSMAPDMAYVLSGSRFNVWAHGFPGVITFCLPATFAASWLVVRVMAPIVPDHLPDLGPFHVHDYRGLATHRFRIVRFVVWAELGALSHVFLDEFTHNWGWFAHHVSWYDNRIVSELLGREWTVYRVFQYVGHVGLTALCIALLWVYGRRRWMQPRAATIAPSPTSVASYTTLWGLSALGLGEAQFGSRWIAWTRPSPCSASASASSEECSRAVWQCARSCYAGAMTALDRAPTRGARHDSADHEQGQTNDRDAERRSSRDRKFHAVRCG